MRIELSHVLRLPPEKGMPGQLLLLILVFTLVLGRIFEPCMSVKLGRHVHFEPLRLLWLILTVGYPRVVELDLFNVSHVKVHSS